MQVHAIFHVLFNKVFYVGFVFIPLAFGVRSCIINASCLNAPIPSLQVNLDGFHYTSNLMKKGDFLRACDRITNS